MPDVRCTVREFPEKSDGRSPSQRAGWVVVYEGTLVPPTEQYAKGKLLRVRIDRVIANYSLWSDGENFVPGNVTWIPSDSVEEI